MSLDYGGSLTPPQQGGGGQRDRLGQDHRCAHQPGAHPQEHPAERAPGQADGRVACLVGRLRPPHRRARDNLLDRRFACHLEQAAAHGQQQADDQQGGEGERVGHGECGEGGGEHESDDAADHHEGDPVVTVGEHSADQGGNQPGDHRDRADDAGEGGRSGGGQGDEGDREGGQRGDEAGGGVAGEPGEVSSVAAQAVGSRRRSLHGGRVAIWRARFHVDRVGIHEQLRKNTCATGDARGNVLVVRVRG